MARAQFKLLIFFTTAGILLASVATAWWFYARVMRPEMRVKSEIAQIEKSDLPRVDPGARRFDAAVDEIREGRLDAGREALYNLLRQFPESPTCVEARRIIGEINLDRLFSPTYLEGKVDYIVQPGDAGLLAIANKHKASLDAITRLNGLRSNVIHPGDHLLIMPMDFDFAVHVADKKIVVLRQGRFFAEYLAANIQLPQGFRLPAQLKLGTKSASAGGKTVSPTEGGYLEADKWIPGSRPGVVIRTEQPARAIPVGAPAEPASAVEPVIETGIFLRREDMEEVFAMARSGASLTLVTSASW